jgi:hypothetical protein
MGTRSTIKFYDNGTYLCTIYTEIDGYLSGVGQQIKDFIKSKKFVNGVGADKNVFNGAGCFVAQYIAKYKDGPGNIYIADRGAAQEYNYKVNIIGEGHLFKYKVIKADVSCESNSEEEYPDVKAYAEVIDLRER